MSPPQRLGFAGTPEFAATILARLIESGQAPVLVLTQPDRPVGRGQKPRPSPVKALATGHGIEVRSPTSLKAVDLAADGLDLLIVAAYGLLLPPHVLAAPRLGCLNVHASLLPRWRGAAPVERAIMAGDRETGVCLMQMDEGLDTGPVYARATLPIGADMTGGQLEAQLAELGAELLVETLPVIETLTPTPQQDAGATYAAKIGPADSRVDWALDSAAIARQVRALAERAPVTVSPDTDPTLSLRLLAAEPFETPPGPPPVPGCVIGSNRKGIVVATVDGTLLITRLQLNRGKGRPMSARDVLNGYPQLAAPGTRYASRREPDRKSAGPPSGTGG